MEFLKKLVGYFLNGILTSIFDGIFSGPTPETKVKEQKTEEKTVTNQTNQTAGEKYSSVLTAAQSLEEFDSQVKISKTELNAKQLNEWKFRTAESGTQLTGSNLFNNNMSGNSITSGSFLDNPDQTKSFVDKVHYNFEVNIGPMSTARVPSVLTDWEVDNGYYLDTDEFGIERKFKNGIMIQEDSYKVSILNSAYDKAVHDAFTELVGTEVKTLAVTQDSNKPSGMIFTSTKPISYAIKMTNSSDNTFLVAPKDNSTGPMVFKGKSYNIRVPFFDMGSNADINSGGWTLIEEPYDFSIRGSDAFSFSEFIGKIAAPDPKTNVKVINLLSLVVGAGDSIAKSYHPAPIHVLVQQKNDERSLIIQAGVGSDVIQSYAGKTVEGPVGNKYFRITLDARHSGDPFTHYVSVDQNGNFVFTRKLYSGDKVEEYVNGGWNDRTAQYLMKSVLANDNVLFQRIDEKLKTVIKPQPRIYAL